MCVYVYMEYVTLHPCGQVHALCVCVCVYGYIQQSLAGYHLATSVYRQAAYYQKGVDDHRVDQ